LRFHYSGSPHPHVVVEEIVAPEVYASMRFPDDRIVPGAKWGLTAGDAQYASLFEDPAWKSLHDTLTGEAFVRTILDTFARDLRQAGCLVDPARASVVPLVESREEKERSVLATEGDPNELFTRLDFQSKGDGGYRDFVHLDWARRVVGGILFFSDAEEEGLEGGELALYRDRDFRNDRWSRDPELTALFPPKHNSGVIFLNSNEGFHGPRAITALRGRRRWLYYTISSRVDVWPCEVREPSLTNAG
jgi:hypothetical protein